MNDSISAHTKYRLQTLRGDIYGGLTAAVVALPLALAFGVASGAGPLAGLYGAILVGFFSAAFGGTPSQISGPTGPMTVAMALLFTRFADEPALAFTAVILGGAFQMVFGVLKFGRYINLVPYSVISGFMTGIGAIIIVLQLAPLTGHDAPDGVMLAKIAALPGLLANPDFHALALGALTLGIVYLTPKRIARLLPPSLLALVAGSLAGIWFFPDAPVIGAIPSGLPDFRAPVFSLEAVPLLLHSALVLAFLGSVDSLLTSLIADSITRTHHDSNRELIGQGIGNVVAGFFGGIPGAGATMRTVVNVRAGGRTRLSGVIHALVLLVIALGFGDAASHIPRAVLAGILLKVGTDIIDWRYLKLAVRTPRPGVLIMLTTFVLTVVVDLVTAVAVGVVMASVLFVKRVSEAQMRAAKLVTGPAEDADLSEEEAAILERGCGRIVLFSIEGPLSFGSAKDVSRLLTSQKGMDVLLMDLSEVPFIDSTAALALEEVLLNARRDGDRVVLCGMREKVMESLRQLGILDLIDPRCLAPGRLEAMRLAESFVRSERAKE